MRIRIKFRKNGVMRFVGHLDTMRYFQKAIRRAGIDIAYSKGFSPHQIMSFAAPLGVGMTSDGEYFDIEVHSTAPAAESMDALNAAMAEGMEIVSYVALDDGERKAMAAVAAADYIAYYKGREDFSQGEIAEMIPVYYTERNQIPVTKQGKKRERIIDLKPLIYQFLPYEDEPQHESPEHVIADSDIRRGFFLRLSTGSTDHIRPGLVLSDFYSFFGREYHPFSVQVHRLELYEKTDEGFSPLCLAGKEIL